MTGISQKLIFHWIIFVLTFNYTAFLVTALLYPILTSLGSLSVQQSVSGDYSAFIFFVMIYRIKRLYNCNDKSKIIHRTSKFKHPRGDISHMDCYPHGDVIKWKHCPRYWPFVRGIHRPPVNSPHNCQLRRVLIFDLRLNKWLSKQSWSWWFETPSCSLWRHCNEKNLFMLVFWLHIICQQIH